LQQRYNIQGILYKNVAKLLQFCSLLYELFLSSYSIHSVRNFVGNKANKIETSFEKYRLYTDYISLYNIHTQIDYIYYFFSDF